jgi:hypothetical protein
MVNKHPFIKILYAEWFKYKRNSGWMLLILFPVLITCFVLGVYMSKSDELTYGVNYWIDYSKMIFFLYGFYPILIGFSVFSFINVEYKNHGWKSFLTLPIKKSELYWAKLIVVVLSITLSVMLAYSLFILSGNLLNAIFHLGMNEYDFAQNINFYFTRLLLFSYAIAVIQFNICLLSSNFALSTGFAFFANIVSLLASSWKYIWLIPYAGHYQAMQQYYNEDAVFWQKSSIAALCYIVLFSFLGLIVFFKRKQR